MWPFKRKKKSGAADQGKVLADARALLSSGGKTVPAAASGSDAPSRGNGQKTAARAPFDISKKREKELEHEVRELYTEPDGTIPDMTTIERGRGHRLRNALIGLVVFFGLLAAVAWTGFFVFAPYARFTPDALTLSVTVPPSARSGEEATITVRYGAAERVGIGSLEIGLKLPQEFALERADPPPADGLHWTLGSLAPGASGTLTLTGRVRGTGGTLLTAQAFADYVPANFNSEFQSVASGAFPISGSVLALDATSTARALPGEPVKVEWRYRNEGTAPIDDVAFRATMPPGFVLAKAEPPVSEGSAFWKLGTVEPGAEGAVILRGTFSSDAKGDLPFTGELGIAKEAGNFALQAASSTPVAVIGGDLVITTIVNGNTNGLPVGFGERVHATVSYANRSEAMLEDTVLTMHLLGTPQTKDGRFVYDPATIEDSAKGVNATTTLTWTKEQIPKLAKLAPGEEGTFDVSLRLAAAPYAPGVKDYKLELWVEGKVGKVNGVKKDRIVQSSRFSFPFFSDLRFRAESRYYNDDEIAVGTGPLPPKVGQETTYRVFWTVENALHELRNLTVKTTLPENVRFTGKTDVSAGAIAYDSSSRTVTWTLNKLPIGAPKVSIDFETGLIPGEAAVGNILPVTGVANMDAEDAVVAGHLIRSEDPVDTSLVGDPLGKGKGVVTK